MKRYLLFTAQNDCCMRECAQFGWHSFRGSYNSPDDALLAFYRDHAGADYGQCIDTETLEVLEYDQLKPVK